MVFFFFFNFLFYFITTKDTNVTIEQHAIPEILYPKKVCQADQSSNPIDGQHFFQETVVFLLKPQQKCNPCSKYQQPKYTTDPKDITLLNHAVNKKTQKRKKKHKGIPQCSIQSPEKCITIYYKGFLQPTVNSCDMAQKMIMMNLDSDDKNYPIGNIFQSCS